MNLYQALTGFIDRHAGREAKAWLRARWQGARSRSAPLLRRWHGSFDADALRAHLSATVGEDWSVLFVHSSIGGMQPMFTGSALDLVRMLVDWTGPARTLAMPAFYFGDPRIGGAGRTFQANPVFDLRRTPSQMGLPSELFRRWKGARSSRNPVYRVSALGPLADELIAGHEHAPTLRGEGTPFAALDRHDALILGIGKPFEVMTHVHHAEDLLGEAFPVPLKRSEPLPMTLIEGTERIPYLLPRSGLAWRRDMWRLRRLMTPQTLREWRFHGVPLFAARARDVTRAIIEGAARGETIYVRP